MDENIFEMNDKRLCAHCFSNVEQDDNCQKCRCGIQSTEVLPEGTVVKGRYLIGSCMYYDKNYYGYYGYDLSENCRVLIREVFPLSSLCKRVDKNLVCDVRDPAMLAEFRKIIDNFHMEVKIMSGIKDSSTVLAVRDLFDENGTSYCVVDFSEDSILLSDYIKNRGGYLSTGVAMRIFGDMVKALDTLHQLGIVHGNIRPENLVICNKKIMLTGFNYGGHAFLDDKSSPLYTTFNEFAALEQLSKNGRRGPWTDVYGLGSTLYFMLTGRYPVNVFERVQFSDDTTTPSAIVQSSEIPQKLVPILEKMLDPKIDGRYSDLFELAADLKKAGILNIKVKPQKKQKSEGNKKPVIVIAAIVLVAVIAGALFFFTGGKGESGGAEQSSSVQSEAASSTDESGTVSSSAVPSESSDTAETTVTVETTQPAETVETNIDLPGLLDEAWEKNVLRISEKEDEDPFFFGRETWRKTWISYVVVKDSLAGVSNSAWDVSETQDKSVMAWTEDDNKGRTLYIAAEGGINAGDSCRNMFADYKNLKSVSFNSAFHTDNVTDMSGMFKNCENLESVDLTDFVTEKVTTMKSMFEGCSNLTKADLGSFNTSGVVNFSKMFYGCSQIGKLDLSSCNTMQAKDLSNMFNGCSSLRELKIKLFFVTESANTSGMFDGCSELDSIDAVNTAILEVFDKRKK